MTFVYYQDEEEEEGKETLFQDLQIAFIQNETSNNLIKVTDANLASILNLKPGTFHCYYKPSFANYNPEHAFKCVSSVEREEAEVRKYPTVADQLLNEKYMDKFELDADFVQSEEF